MSRLLNVNFAWPYLIGMIGLIAAGGFIVRVIIGTFYGTFGIKGAFFSIIGALVLGGFSWLFVRIAQANQETDEESEA